RDLAPFLGDRDALPQALWPMCAVGPYKMAYRLPRCAPTHVCAVLDVVESAKRRIFARKVPKNGYVVTVKCGRNSRQVGPRLVAHRGAGGFYRWHPFRRLREGASSLCVAKRAANRLNHLEWVKPGFRQPRRFESGAFHAANDLVQLVALLV